MVGPLTADGANGPSIRKALEMARPAALAVGGFVPLPVSLLASIAALVACTGRQIFVDPCAGEGEAIFGLLSAIAMASGETDEEREAILAGLVSAQPARVLACEMEATRFAALQGRARDNYRNLAVHGDAFRIRPQSREGIGTVMLLNPPFEPDRRFGRLEEKWLRRFGPMLRQGGALLFVLPFYALDASAETLAREFDVLGCFRFDPWPDIYKRVLVVARRRAPLLAADAETEARVRGWAAAPETIPMMPAAGPALLKVEGPDHDTLPHDAWQLAALDEKALAEQHVPWCASDRGGRLQPIANAVPASDFHGLLAPRFPLATVPRPAHLAAGLASGVLSGAQLHPTDRGSGLPEILVRGTFRRRFLPIEEKFNKNGDKVGELQAQVPELEIVALDLSKGTFHTLASSVEQTGARTVADMTAGDLIASYGRDLLATLRDRCPALYDPSRAGDVTPLPEIPGGRPLFSAQAHAVRAVSRLLATGDRTAILLGEVGTGKTSVSLRAAHAVGARRVIVITPPHVVEGFAAQVPSIWPAARVARLETIADVDAFMADRDEAPVVALLSREDAKLGHAWEGIGTGRCPRCGAGCAAAPEELAKGRTRCTSSRWEATGWAGRMAARIAGAIHLAAPSSVNAQAFMPGRIARKMREAAREQKGDWAGWPAAREALRALVPALLSKAAERGSVEDALVWLLAAIGDRALMAETAHTLYVGSSFDTSEWGRGSEIRRLARTLLLAAGEAGAAVAAEIRDWQIEPLRGVYTPNPWLNFDGDQAKIARGEKAWPGTGWTVSASGLGANNGDPIELGSVLAAVRALDVLVECGQQRRTRECGEPLFQAVPKPRRYPLAHYMAKRYRGQLRAGGFAFILDEAHEHAAEGSAQALASQQLLGLRIPTICMTGSVMNGYAESLFNLLWWTSAAFRAEFDRKDRADFVRAYGYVKQIVEERDEKGERVLFGAMTDRVERVARETGQAPGVLPTLLLRHLLPRAVTLQMSDIEEELPPAREIPVPIVAEGDLADRYRKLQRDLLAQIKRDRFDKDCAGRLFGQLAELPSVLDRLTLDVSGDAYEIRYPDGAGHAAGKLVSSAETFPTTERTPKERALLDLLRAELGEGRNVVVFAWHLDLIPRLARLASEVGRTSVLDAGKVPPGKRDAWIAKEIAKKARVLVLNPVCVSTGINSMVPCFSSVVWYENPACNPLTRRQANGRVRRIGQDREARFYSLVYEDTAQAVAQRLLMHKSGIGEAADGLDATAALHAAGVGAADITAAQDLGRVLFEALTRDDGMRAAA